MNTSLIIYKSPLAIHVEDHATKIYLTKNGMEIKIEDLSDYNLKLFCNYILYKTTEPILHFHFLVSCTEELNRRGKQNEHN